METSTIDGNFDGASQRASITLLPKRESTKAELKLLISTECSFERVISVSLESVLHYREQWKNYRSTEQFIGHEVMAYRTAVGQYRNLDAERALDPNGEPLDRLLKPIYLVQQGNTFAFGCQRRARSSLLAGRNPQPPKNRAHLFS
jgi:hypothetical protein